MLSAVRSYRLKDFLQSRAYQVVLYGAGVIEFGRFAFLAAYYFPSGLANDSGIYFSVGRAALNGWRVYIDIFESKPPVIFWLSAASLLATNSDLLYRMLHIIGLASLPILLPLVVRRERSSAFLFGAAVASFAITRTLGYQTEGFGLVVAVLSILSYLQGRIVLSGLLLSIAVLVKEPFALSILGAFLLSEKRDWWKVLAVGVGFWFAILVITGMAHGYFTLYLPEMLLGRVRADILYEHAGQNLSIHAPLWIRSINVYSLFRNLWMPPSRGIPAFPLLSLALLALFVGHPMKDRWSVLRGIAILAAILGSRLLFSLEQIVSFVGYFPLSDSFFQLKSAELVLFGLVFVASLGVLWWKSPSMLLTGVQNLLALWLAMAAVSTGGDYFDNHFLFAVPVFLGAFLHSPKSALVTILLVLNAVYPRYSNWSDIALKVSQERQAAVAYSEDAAKLDQLMDACGFERYFIAGVKAGYLQGYTVHSPYQIYYAVLRSMGENANPFLRAKFLRDFEQTRLIVMARDESMYAELDDDFRSRFTALMPSCAFPSLPLRGVSVYFRK